MGEATRIGISPRELVAGMLELSSPPEIYTRISRLINDGRSSAEQVADILQQDPGLTARVLKIVNSAFYGYPSQISSIGRAITILGYRELKDIVLTTTVMEMFRGIPNELVNMHTFWRGSLRCAVISKVLASRHHRADSIESIFTAGMLHDIGHLIIYSKMPELARKALLEQIYQEREIQEVERDLWGFDYSTVGGELARHWKLPRILEHAIGFHVMYFDTKEYPVEAAIVHIASRIARLPDVTFEQVERLMPASSPVWKAAGIRFERVPEILQTAESQYQDSLRILI